MVTAPARRDLVRWMQSRGMTERRGLQVVGMSASSLRYQPRSDHNMLLRAKIIALAQRHRRYGAEMIYLKLRQAGELVNHKRVSGCIRSRSCKFGVGGARRFRSASVSHLCAPELRTRCGRWISLCSLSVVRRAP